MESASLTGWEKGQPKSGLLNIDTNIDEDSLIEKADFSSSPLSMLRGGELAMLAVFVIKMFEIVVEYSLVVSCLVLNIDMAQAAFFSLGLRRLGMIAGNETYKKMIYTNGSRIVMMLGTLPLIA